MKLYPAAIAIMLSSMIATAATAEPYTSAPQPPSGEASTPVDAEAPADPTALEAFNWHALNWDLSKLAPVRGQIRTPATTNPRADWNRVENRDGTAAVTVKRALPTGWDSNVGMDFNVAGQRPAAVPSLPGALAPEPDQTGAAWATITAPGVNLPIGWDKTTINARIDPLHDQRTLGTTLSRSVPLNDGLSVTLQNGYSLSHSAASAWAGNAAASDAQVLTTDTSAKLNVLPTGTSLSVGAAKSTLDERWLRTLSTEQKLFGGVSVTGAISETTDGEPNRSLSAGFKRQW
jgi:hypothetical protein